MLDMVAQQDVTVQLTSQFDLNQHWITKKLASPLILGSEMALFIIRVLSTLSLMIAYFYTMTIEGTYYGAFYHD